MRPKVLIPLTTFSLISLPMLIMSIKMGGFWINSQYDFPFVLIPAFLIGDPLILPPLNYHIYLALKQVMSLIQKPRIFWTVSFCFLISTIFNGWTHYLWSHDKFTSFIDPQYGVLSLAGWWHYGVSVLQITGVFSFGAFGIQTVRQQNQDMFKAFEKATYILIAFSIVNTSGAFISKDLILLKHFSLNLILTNLLSASIPLFMEIVFLLYMKKTHQQVQFSLAT